MPAPKGLSPCIKDNTDGSISVEYKPSQQGRHEVQMCYEGAAVEGSPFSCIVGCLDGGFVTAFGPGLIGGMSGQSETFSVVCKHGSLKDIAITIDGPSRIDVKREDKGDRTEVSYMPMTPGAYNIFIKHNGKNIKGSPFGAKVSGEGRKRSQLSLTNASDFPLSVLEPDVVDLVGSLKLPSGAIEPCILRKLGDGHLGLASFQPREKGTYQVQIYRDEKHIKGSPFKANVGDNEVPCAAKVKVTGATTNAIANKANLITVDTTDCGYGSLTVVLEGPHRSEIEYDHGDGRVFTIDYAPHEPGIYILNVRFADEHVPGSPFLMSVTGDPSGRIRETIVREMPQAQAVNPGDHCEFLLKIPGTNPFDMEASVTDPEGSTELCDVMDEEDSHYRIMFEPKVEGIHTLSIKHKALHVSGSPFQYSVGQLSSGGSHKVQVGGPGLERGEVGLSNSFNVYTREAGEGTLHISIEGQSKPEIKIEDRPHGFMGVAFKVTKPGLYGLHIKFGDEHIPLSPFMVHIAPDSGSARQVTVHSLKDRGLAVDKPITFSVNFNGAEGTLHACVRTPTGAHEDCFVQEMDKGVYAIRFIPKENGVHYIDIRLNEAHIPDSPFAVMVGSCAADPAMCHALGEGLESGKCGQKNKFIVRTAGSGSGILACFMEGPSKAALSCKELDEGYEFTYTAFAPGKYLITVKYGNINIAGSPYACAVTGAGRKPSPLMENSSMIVETVEKKAGGKVSKKFHGDASKVVARGPGLKKAFMNRVLNFMLETRDAGQALLSVGMINEKGFPEEELAVTKKTNTSYQVSYKVREAGEHTLVIKWGDDDIPGSPFCLCT